MKNAVTIYLSLSLLVFASCSNNKGSATNSNADSVVQVETGTDTLDARKARAELSGTKADTVVKGSADFTTSGDKVELTLNIECPKKANQSVAVHFHEHGDCGNNGEGAHGHWNPTKEKHGKWGEGAYHSGDIGNIKLDAQGKAQFTVSSDRWTIGGDEKTNILKRAIIVHSGVDDYTTQPTGNSGSRIGCGVIEEMK
ncbi:superoxide dismutase family protein [Desertivirga brevis]|uniref:superoxide dismutase family protein n=1 Tax=Desertivirga brevis TaxID=2810310 RepID=UPI001A975CC8|nr:superoxide dismutase family protein [Pedobacter sp. SYSU D00873]